MPRCPVMLFFWIAKSKMKKSTLLFITPRHPPIGLAGVCRKAHASGKNTGYEELLNVRHLGFCHPASHRTLELAPPPFRYSPPSFNFHLAAIVSAGEWPRCTPPTLASCARYRITRNGKSSPVIF